jgi:acyl-CoA thioester hydrolase
MKIRVYYEDTDAATVVYYANYLKYYERVRTEFLRNHNLLHHELKQKFGILFVVKDVNISYIRPALLDDLLEVSAKIKQVKKFQFVISQDIKREKNIINKANVTIACVDDQSFKPKLIPTEILNIFYGE